MRQGRLLKQKAPKKGGNAYEAHFLVYNQNSRYYGDYTPRHEWTRRLNPSTVVGGLILGSKIPVNLAELFILFLERTIISLLIAAPVAHMFFTS